MRRAAFALALGLLTLGAADAAAAADLAKVPRTLARPPVFRTPTQRYCLLVFGPSADFRVWLVLDGDRLHVDRNGNGDLTEPDEFTTPEKDNTDPASFKPVTLLLPDGRKEELGFALYGWFDYQKGKASDKIQPSVHVWWQGRWYGSWGDESGPCVWGTRPENAPVLHVGGPLRMGFEIPAAAALRRKEKGVYELFAGVGTPGLGSGAFVHLSYAKGAIPEGFYPVADLEFPSKTPGGPPVRVRAVLKQRC